MLRGVVVVFLVRVQFGILVVGEQQLFVVGQWFQFGVQFLGAGILQLRPGFERIQRIVEQFESGLGVAIQRRRGQFGVTIFRWFWFGARGFFVRLG